MAMPDLHHDISHTKNPPTLTPIPQSSTQVKLMIPVDPIRARARSDGRPLIPLEGKPQFRCPPSSKKSLPFAPEAAFITSVPITSNGGQHSQGHLRLAALYGKEATVGIN